MADKYDDIIVKAVRDGKTSVREIANFYLLRLDDAITKVEGLVRRGLLSQDAKGQLSVSEAVSERSKDVAKRLKGRRLTREGDGYPEGDNSR